MTKVKDITGQKFGRLTVVERVGNDKHGGVLWKCKCDCGNYKVTSLNSLRNGYTKSCGCLFKDLVKERTAKRFKDITGARFNHLKVLSFAFIKKHQAYWLCKCDCGREKILRGDGLRSGHSKTCGACNNHGQSETRIYKIWLGIKQRCLNKRNSSFLRYGARGIKVCNEWSGENGFVEFLNWSNSHGYKENLTIDRIDNNGDYSPENCRWVSLLEQARNRRNNVFYLVNGKRKSLVELVELLALDYNKVQHKRNFLKITDPYEIFKGGKELEKYKIERLK